MNKTIDFIKSNKIPIILWAFIVSYLTLLLIILT